MYKFYRKSGILIPNEYKNESFYKTIKEFLVRRSKKYNTSDFTKNIFYLESNIGMLIPRFFPIERFIVKSNFIIEETLKNVDNDIQINHNITPRNETQTEAMNYMITNKSGILQLPPGVGKTVITIYMIAERKKKSLILVHRDSLVEQWRERFEQFTDLDLDDITRLSSKTFEEDLSKPIIVTTVQTFLSLLKRNRKEFLSELGNSNIGILTADEIHTSIGAPLFSECSIHIPAYYTYGLSATPYRYDGNGDIIEFHLGSIFAKDNDEGTMSANVSILFINYEIDTPKRKQYLYWSGDFQRSRYLNLMRKSSNFMSISKLLLDKLKNDREIIFVSERIKLIDDLYKWLQFESKGRFTGSAKKDQLEYKVTFSTPGKIRDGVDVPKKDALIITSPISNIEQLSGRITRSNKGKQTPIIIDMVDIGCKRISSTLHKRIKFYESKGWNIKFMFASEKENKIIEIPKDKAYKVLKGDKN